LTIKITGSDFYISTFLSVDCCRWREYDYEDLINRDKASLDSFRLRDESLEESDNLPDPDVLAQEIVEDLEAALEQFREIASDLGGAPLKETP
jgi:type I restriction enzyme M protein